LDIACQIESYKNSAFDKKEKNWPDFSLKIESGSDKPYSFFCGWCHGGPGIGLSRLKAYEVYGFNRFIEQSEAAIENMKKHTSCKSTGYSRIFK